MKKFLFSKIGFFTIAVLLFWIKTYFIYLNEFDLGVDNNMQAFLVFFNPLSSALFFLGIALFARGKRVGTWIIILNSLLTFILYANVVYYRFFSDFITLPTLTQTSNINGVAGSIGSLLAWQDLMYTVDILLLIGIFVSARKKWSLERIRLRNAALVLTAGVAAFAFNLQLAEADRPQLLERTFDRTYIVKYLGAFNYTIYDAIQSTNSSAQRVLADENDITEVERYVNAQYAEPNEKYFGAAKGKNIIKIHLESFQTFLINYKLNGEEVTPFLNSLVNKKESDFMFFKNYFHQTAQGKTSDAELMLDTSLYGLPQGSAFSLKGKNTYQAAPAILQQEDGYESAIMHGDEKTFWNRNNIYKQFGVDKYFSADHYDMSEENVLNYGLKDKPFFEQSIPMLQSLEQPFYAHLMTLTHHYPFNLDERDATIPPAETGDKTVDQYFQTARYLDEALKAFFEDLKAQGLYKDSVIMLYGDHYGISENHNRAMSELLGKKMTEFQNAQMQRVPLFLRVPGVEGGVKNQYAGAIDVLPTLLHLLGIDASKYIQFGTDILSPEHDGVVAFRNGDYVSKKYTFTGGTYYDTQTGKVLEPSQEMINNKENVMRELELSDEVLYGDLLRFYQPEGWTPVDASDYSYNFEVEEIIGKEKDVEVVQPFRSRKFLDSNK